MKEMLKKKSRHHYWWVLRWQLPFSLRILPFFWSSPKDIPPRIGFCKKISSLTQHIFVRNIN